MHWSSETDLLVIIQAMVVTSLIVNCFADFSKAFDSVNYWKLFQISQVTVLFALLLICWPIGMLIRIIMNVGAILLHLHSLSVMVCVRVLFYHTTCLHVTYRI